MPKGGPNRAQSFSGVASPGMLCRLAMHDSRGDGWQGAAWSGFGQEGLTLEDGFEKSVTFVVPHLPPSPPLPPPAPPSQPSYPPPLPPPPLLLLPPRQPLVQLTGPCCLTDGGSCATSPHYPSSYGDSEECTITGVPRAGLEVVAFDVEGFSFCETDYLTVNGKKYCGNRGPEGVVVEGGIIEWVSDSIVVKSGWKARPGLTGRP